MTVETGISFINQLNETYPRKNDLIKEGDDHIRLVKQVLKLTLPNFDRAVSMSAATMNTLNAAITATADTLTFNTGITSVANKTWNFAANKLTNVGDPTNAQDAVTLNYLNTGGGASVAWPVNSIFMTLDTRNPNAIFGFGSWTAFAQGRCIIGSGVVTDTRGEARVFNANNQGGELQHTITYNEMPSHAHSHNLTGTASASGDHSHSLNGAYKSGGGQHIGQGSNTIYISQDQTGVSGSHTHAVTISGGIGAAGGNASMNLMQPYFVVNIWRRVA